jgi:hypothetical protein
MLDILQERYFNEHYSHGFVETGISLDDDLVDEIKQHYLKKEEGHNDFPKFFVNNEHQAYQEGNMLGFLLNAFPNLAKNMIKKFYDKAYRKAVYCEQAFVEKVLNHLLQKDFQRFFKTRYMVASYDMYLRNNHECPGAGIHFDLPNFHHFYETENDLSIYIPLVDLDEDNGGRLKALPESKLKAPGNVLLKMLYRHFSEKPEYLDANGYIDPEKISHEDITAFVKSQPHRDLMQIYKSVTGMARQRYANEFNVTTETKGRVLLFNNKNFHAAEQWKNANVDREIYAIRMFPIYDVKINLKKQLHGTRFNNVLLDTHKGEVRRYDEGIDFSRIAAEDKVKL